MLSNLRKLLLHSKVRSGFQRVRDFPKMKAIYWYRLKTPQCRISRDNEENNEGGTFYPGDDEKSYSSYGFFVDAWMPLPEPYREGE